MWISVALKNNQQCSESWRVPDTGPWPHSHAPSATDVPERSESERSWGSGSCRAWRCQSSRAGPGSQRRRWRGWLSATTTGWSDGLGSGWDPSAGRWSTSCTSSTPQNHLPSPFTYNITTTAQNHLPSPFTYNITTTAQNHLPSPFTRQITMQTTSEQSFSFTSTNTNTKPICNVQISPSKKNGIGGMIGDCYWEWSAYTA